MATTIATKILTANDDKTLQPQDLRNPMFRLLLAENSGKGTKLTPFQLPKTSHQSSSLASTSVDDSKRRHFLPESVCNRVENSWSLVQNDLEELGLDFFLRVFESSPELLTLLPYGQSYLDLPPSKRKEQLKQCPLLRVHSVHVMTAVGNCVAGLSDIESLIPSLRSLGKTHRMAGVDESHYKKLFSHLSDTIKEKIGANNFDDETAEAWELVYFSLSSIMYQRQTLETESVAGWHEVIVIASLYLIVSAPFRLAGFSAHVPWMESLFNYFDAIALMLFVIDLSSDHIVSVLRVKYPKSAWAARYSSRHPPKQKSKFRQRFDLACVTTKVHLKRKIRSLGIDQWISWPTTDKFVIAGLALQHSASAPIGLHWMQVFGLLLLAAATARIVHAVRCEENNMLLRYYVGQNTRTMIRIAKLILVLAFVTHVSACLWLIIARIELGPSAVEVLPSEFFPEPSLLNGQAGTINGYARSIMWAFANLAGIGDVDSTATTTLECITKLLVNVCGMTLYAITTGNVVALLEEYTTRDNQLGNDLADLRTFFAECQIPSNVQNRMLEGYLMRNVLSTGHESGCDEADCGAPVISNDALRRLPRHLQQELKVYERAEALQRRGKAFQDCSADFIFALCGELRGNQMLLPGDYLFKEGEIPRHVIVIDSGTMEIEVEGKTIRILQKGDLLGKPWLLAASGHDKCMQVVTHIPNEKSFSEWLDLIEGSSRVKIRAMSEVRLATGLSLEQDVVALRKRFPKDFATLQHDRDRVVTAVQNVSAARNVFKAQVAFKMGLKRAPSA